MVSLIIVAVILVSTWGLLRDSLNYSMDAVPENVNLPAIKKYFTRLEFVKEIHDLHIWPMSTTEVALTVHIVVNKNSLDNNFLSNIQQHLHDHFGIEHSTIQVETSIAENNCMLDSNKHGKKG